MLSQLLVLAILVRGDTTSSVSMRLFQDGRAAPEGPRAPGRSAGEAAAPAEPPGPARTPLPPGGAAVDGPRKYLKEKPEGWTMDAWQMYNSCYEAVSPLQGRESEVVGTVMDKMGVRPDNCVLKLAYTLYTEPGEDDYPYMPMDCGPGFHFLLGATERSPAPVSVVLVVVLSWLRIYAELW